MLNPHIGWVLVAIASKTWNNSPWHCVYFELRAGRTNDEYQRWAVEKCVLILLCWLTSKGQWEKPTSSHSVIDKNRTCSVVLPVISSPTANQKNTDLERPRLRVSGMTKHQDWYRETALSTTAQPWRAQLPVPITVDTERMEINIWYRLTVL